MWLNQAFLLAATAAAARAQSVSFFPLEPFFYLIFMFEFTYFKQTTKRKKKNISTVKLPISCNITGGSSTL